MLENNQPQTAAQSEPATQAATSKSDESTATATWNLMLEGNDRFAAGEAIHPHQDATTRANLVEGQHPDAAVLSCSDSREIPEMIFDQGFGDMFTIRTAGQVLDDSVVASLEYAVEHLHVSLIVVLGHEHCGAVASAIEAVDALVESFGEQHEHTTTIEATNTYTGRGTETERHEAPENATERNAAERQDELMERLIAKSDSIIVRSVGASVQQAREADLDSTDDFERVHIARTIEGLIDRSPVIQQALSTNRIRIAGARYLLSTGKVEVLSL